MKSRVFIYPLVLIFSLVQGEKPFDLKEERRFSGFEIYPIDVNQDKVDELLKVGKANIQLFDQKGRFFWDFYFAPLVLKSASVCDYDKDGVKEIFLTHSDGLNEIVDCYRVTKPNDLIKRINTVTGVDRNHDGKWDGGVTVIDGIDANDDGKYDLLLNVGCSFDIQPRGLAVYDIETGKELWHYWIGPAVDNVILEDLNNDGKPEIVIGTYSPANGSEANNTSDTESYVIVLDRKGKLLWQNPIGEYFTFTQIGISDIDQDGKKEVIATQSSRKQESEEPDKIVILNGATGKEKKFLNTGDNFWGEVCLDINQDGKDEIITGNSDGKIRMFNADLDEILNFENNTGIDVMGACDLIGDGRGEIIATTEDDKLIIFNSKLNVIAQMKLEKNILHGGFGECFGIVKLVKTQKEKKLLIRIANKDESDFILYRFDPVPFVKKPNYFIITAFALIIFLLILFYVLWWLNTSNERFVKNFYSKVTEIGYIFIDKKGKVKIANAKAETLLGLKNLTNSNLLERLKQNELDKLYNAVSNFERLENVRFEIKTAKEEKVLSINIYPILKRNTLTIRIEDMTRYEHLEKIESWAPVAQKLAHGIKTPLMNIQLGVQQLETNYVSLDAKTQKVVENIDAETNRLKKLVDNFMKFAQLTPPNLAPEKINEILKNLVLRYSLALPPEIRIKLDLNDEIPKLLLDKKEIEEAFTIIINNAIEAMTKTGILNISTSLLQHFAGKIKDWVQITITDTGKGIPERYIKDVFTPYFVYDKPQGIGLGLHLAKRIVGSHNGTIEINSKEEIGTTVIINLPAIS
jgi:nitrogen-specific signal transduction histidine kinase